MKILVFLRSYTEMIRKLIEMNAELDTLNEDSMSPVDYGISSDKKEIHSILRGIDKKKSKRMKDWVSNKYWCSQISLYFKPQKE